MKRHVEVKTRPLFGTQYTIYEMCVDGIVERSQITPYDVAELKAVSRIGPPVDPLAIRHRPMNWGRDE